MRVVRKWLGLGVVVISLFILGACSLNQEPSSFIQSPAKLLSEEKITGNLEQIVKNYLPSGAKLLVPAHPVGINAIQQVDVDEDGQDELLVTFKVGEQPGEAGVLVLKQKNGDWEKIWETKGNGYDIDWAGFADLTGSGRKDLLLGWTIGASIGNGLDIYTWKNGTFQKIASNAYHILDPVEYYASPYEAPKTLLALWSKDTGEAYMVDVYMLRGEQLVPAPEAYPLYFKEKVVGYYEQKVAEMPDAPFYWYYLADAQLKSGMYAEAVQSVEKGLSLKGTYPEKAKFEEILEKAKEELEKQTLDSAKQDENTSDSTITVMEFPRIVLLEKVWIRQAAIKGIERHWHVRNGGAGDDGEILSIDVEGMDYRLLGSDLATLDQLTAYLQESFTEQATHEFIQALSIKEIEGKLYQPNADGGSLLDWLEADVQLLHDSGQVKEYEFSVPLGHLEEVEQIRIIFEKIDGVGWRLAKVPGF